MIESNSDNDRHLSDKMKIEWEPARIGFCLIYKFKSTNTKNKCTLLVRRECVTEKLKNINPEGTCNARKKTVLRITSHAAAARRTMAGPLQSRVWLKLSNPESLDLAITIAVWLIFKWPDLPPKSMRSKNLCSLPRKILPFTASSNEEPSAWKDLKFKTGDIFFIRGLLAYWTLSTTSISFFIYFISLCLQYS